MLKKTITFNDLDGNPVTEDFWFHMSKAELAKMEMTAEGGLAKQLEVLVETGNAEAILQQFEKLILTSYGVRSEDNRRFVKSESNRNDFVSTDAYSVLFMELVTDATAAAEFVRGIVPQDLSVNSVGLDQGALLELPVQNVAPDLTPEQVAEAVRMFKKSTGQSE